MSDPLADLRNVKVPMWAKALGWWRNRQLVKAEKNKTIFVCTIKGWVWHHGIGRHVYGWYNLYRRANGKCWYVYGYNHDALKGWEKLHGVYGTIINPWMNGAWDDGDMRKAANDLYTEPMREK